MLSNSSDGSDNITMGYGTYRLKKENVYKLTRHAIESGINHIDTAPLYGNIEEVGRAIGDSNRRDLFITAKISRDSLEKCDIVNSIKDTMKRMRLNYLDEVILHEPINHIENWKLLSDYYQTEGRGLIGTIGVSNFNTTHLQNIIDDPTTSNPSVNQIEINPFLTRESLPNFCTANGIKIVAHSPLAKGELLNNHELKKIAEEYNVSCAQIMLRWGVEKGFRVIPRSSDFKHIEENMLIDFKINEEDMTRLNNLDCGYSTHPKYLTPTEKKIFDRLKLSHKKKRSI